MLLTWAEQKDFPSSVVSPSLVPIELLHFVFPTRSLQMGDHTHFVQEEPPGFRRLTKIWTTCVVEDVSMELNILTLDFSTTLERQRPFFLLGCKEILRRRLVLHNQVISQQRPSLLKLSFETQTNPDLRYKLGTWIVFRSVTSEHNSASVLLVLWFQSVFFEMTDVHQRCKLPE